MPAHENGWWSRSQMLQTHTNMLAKLPSKNTAMNKKQTWATAQMPLWEQNRLRVKP
jgi:hypothetical protein